MAKKTYSEELRRTLLDLVASKGVTVREAAARVGVSYSTATRWVHRSRTALVPKPPKFAQLVRETDLSSVIYVRVGRAEIAVRRGVDIELLRTVVDILSGGAA